MYWEDFKKNHYKKEGTDIFFTEEKKERLKDAVKHLQNDEGYSSVEVLKMIPELQQKNRGIIDLSKLISRGFDEILDEEEGEYILAFFELIDRAKVDPTLVIKSMTEQQFCDLLQNTDFSLFAWRYCAADGDLEVLANKFNEINLEILSDELMAYCFGCLKTLGLSASEQKRES